MAVMESCSSLLVTAIIVMIAFSPTVTGQTNACLNYNTINNVTQTITSPNYPGNYPNNLDCAWIITAPLPTQVVVLTLVYFFLEIKSSTCAYDHVTINDASNSTEITDEIKKICGSALPQQFISSGRFMLIQFHSDGFGSGPGFQFKYSWKNRSDLCGNASLSAAYGITSTLSSPGYPNPYVSNLDCQWTIRSDISSYVIVLNLLDFTLEGIHYDNLTIYDGPNSSSPVMQTLGGTVPASQFISTGSSLTLVFHTDDSVNQKGFSFQYQSQRKSATCGNNALSAYSFAQNISSPGYPYYYPGNINCQWVISSFSISNVILLNVKDFNVESSPSCTSDNVTIYDGYGTNNSKLLTACGKHVSGQYQSTGMYMTVVFRTDWSGSDSGFKLQYTSRDKSTVCSNSALIATSSASEIKSPNYPYYPYSSDTDCEWHITAESSTRVIVLKVLDFKLEGTAGYCTSAYDYVSIFDGSDTSYSPIQKLCGDQTTTMFVSTGSSMTIQFHTDGTSQYKGFKLQYTSSVKSAVCTGDTLTASWDIGYLASPNSPGAYPVNLDCRWQIQTYSSLDVVVLEVDYFNVAGSGSPCNDDFVTIYDGPTIYSSPLATLCGYRSTGSYKSTGSDMTVAFHSNGGSNYNSGFRFTYKSRSKPTDYSYSSVLGPGAIAGIVICSIGVPFLIVVFVIVLIRRNAAQRLTRTRVPVQNGGVTAVPAVSYVANNQQAYPNQYATVQNPQGMNMGPPGYNTSYYPPPYQYNMPPATAPQGQTPILNNPGPNMAVAPVQSDGGNFNNGFIS